MILAEYYSRSNDPNSRSVQNIFRGLTKAGLFVKSNPVLTNIILIADNTNVEVETMKLQYI